MRAMIAPADAVLHSLSLQSRNVLGESLHKRWLTCMYVSDEVDGVVLLRCFDHLLNTNGVRGKTAPVLACFVFVKILADRLAKQIEKEKRCRENQVCIEAHRCKKN